MVVCAEVPHPLELVTRTWRGGRDAWLDEARTTPTCDPALRGKLYRQVQHQIYQDLPYIMLSGQIKHWAYPSAWQELHPAPWRFDYNVHRWWR